MAIVLFFYRYLGSISYYKNGSGLVWWSNNGECLGVIYQTCKDNNNGDNNGTEY